MFLRKSVLFVLVVGFFVAVLFVLLSVSVSNAIEKAERISDREIVERLTKLETKFEEGQKSINQRLDDLKEGQRNLKEDINSSRDFMTWGFGVIFISISSLAGFVLWDRRSALAPAIRKNKELEEREEVLEKWGKKVDMVLKKLAGGDVHVAEALRQVGLL